MSGESFASWHEKERDAAMIVAEAAGAASEVDPQDDRAVLAWARRYMPRILTHAERTEGLLS